MYTVSIIVTISMILTGTVTVEGLYYCLQYLSFLLIRINSFVIYYIGISLQCPAQYKVTWRRAGPKRHENVLSWEKCSSHCRERPECNYWTWFDENNRIPKDTKCVCITMTKARLRRRRNAHAWSGTRECGGEILNISSSGPLLHVSLFVCLKMQKRDPEGRSNRLGDNFAILDFSQRQGIL